MEYDRACLLLLCATLCSVGVAQLDVDLNILEKSKQMETPGAEVNLTCHLNKGLAVILTHSVQWMHVSPSKPDGKRTTLLTTQQTLTDNASPDDYLIDVKYDDANCNFTLVLKQVKAEHDGSFVCRVERNADGESEQREVQIIVVNNVESVDMQFDGEGSITEENTAPGIQREEGRYGVTCTAHGFNPDASIHIFVGDVEQETGGTQILLDQQASQAAASRRYTATATAPRVDLTADHSGQLLMCMARAGFEGATETVASVPLVVIVLEPNVTCDKNASARPDDLYVKIKCYVDHASVAIDRYRWEIGDSGEIIVPDQTSENYNEVNVQDLDEDTAIVTLDLYRVDEWHFNTYYYLDVFTKNGQQFRTKASLIRLEPESSSSTTAAAMFWVCLLSVTASLFSSR